MNARQACGTDTQNTTARVAGGMRGVCGCGVPSGGAHRHTGARHGLRNFTRNAKERSKFVRRAAAVTQEFAFGPSNVNFHRIIKSVTAVTLCSAKPPGTTFGPTTSHRPQRKYHHRPWPSATMTPRRPVWAAHRCHQHARLEHQRPAETTSFLASSKARHLAAPH